MFPEDGVAVAGLNIGTKPAGKSQHFSAETVKNQVNISISYCVHSSLSSMHFLKLDFTFLKKVDS